MYLCDSPIADMDPTTRDLEMKTPAYAETLLKAMNDLREENGELCDFTILADGHSFQVGSLADIYRSLYFFKSSLFLFST